MKKQIGINMIAQIIAFVINMGISLLLTPFIVENIGAEANGFVNLANNFIQYAQLFTIALNSMAGRFVTIKVYEKNKDQTLKYFSSVFWANLILSIVLTIAFVFIISFLEHFIQISDNLIMDVKILWTFIFLNFIISIFTSVFNISTFVKNRLDLNSIINAKSYIIRAIILIIAFSFGTKKLYYIGIASFIAGIYLLLKNIKIKKILTPELKISRKYFDIDVIKELLRSGIWNTVSKLSSILSTGLDLLLTNIFVSPIAMGILSIAKTIPTAILSLFSNMASIFAPELTKNYAEKKYNDMKKQLISSIKFLGLCSSIPMAILIVLGNNIYSLWTPSQDANLLQILSIISCASLIFALPLEPLYNVFTATNKVKIPSLAILGFSLINIIGVLVGVNIVNSDIARLYIIAGVSTVTGIVRVNTFLPLYSAKCLNVSKWTFYPVILKNVISVILVSIISYILKIIYNPTNWVSLILECIIIFSLGIIINFMFMYKMEERRNIVEMIKKFLKRGKKFEKID